MCERVGNSFESSCAAWSGASPMTDGTETTLDRSRYLKQLIPRTLDGIAYSKGLARRFDKNVLLGRVDLGMHSESYTDVLAIAVIVFCS